MGAPAPSLTGQKIGKWSIGERIKGSKNIGPFYICTCECGKVREIPRSNLVSGTSTQCRGCQYKERVGYFCKFGHDTRECGRDSHNGKCLGCDAERKRIPYVTSEVQREKQKASRIWTLFRLKPEDQKKILDFQGGVCAISGKPPKKQPLSTDHDHLNGRIRGMLGTRINRGLAYFDDNPEMLRKAADYLENPTAPQALGREVFGLIGKARHKKKMIYGSESGPIKASKKERK